MSECKPKVEEIKYKDEQWWRNFFENDLANFYLSVRGFLNARNELLKNYGEDLGKIMADDSKRGLALAIILGGVKKECIDNKVIEERCFPQNSIAYFYKNILGIGLDMNELNAFVNNRVLERDWLKAGSGLKLKGLSSDFINNLNVISQAVAEIYQKLSQSIKEPKLSTEYKVEKAEDMLNYLVNLLNYGIRLLPLYNPFMFFIQSLRSTPKPYLKLMYCEEILNDDMVKNIFNKYGIELTTFLIPNLEKGHDEEFAIIGHRERSVGDLLIKLMNQIYNLFSHEEWYSPYGINVQNELAKYVTKYEGFLKDFLGFIGRSHQPYHQHGLFLYSESLNVKRGVVSISGTDHSYLDFIETSSPAFFLSLIWISKSGYPYAYPYEIFYYYW